MVESNERGDPIPMPKYEQIRSYIANNQNLTKMTEVDAIETYVNKRRFDPRKPNQPEWENN